MTQKDIIDNIQSRQKKEEESTTIGTICEMASFVGFFVFYVGVMRLFTPNEFTNGLITMLFGGIAVLAGMYVPEWKAAMHARDKKYIVMYVFYGSKMIRRDIELLEDPQVIARQTEKDEVEFVKKEDDSDYEIAIRALGVDYLTDKDVDKKFDEALKDRYIKSEAKIGHRSSLWKWPYKHRGKKNDK